MVGVEEDMLRAGRRDGAQSDDEVHTSKLKQAIGTIPVHSTSGRVHVVISLSGAHREPADEKL